MQRCPAGLPSGIPGIAEVIEGAMQQAPHPRRQSIKYHPVQTFHEGYSLIRILFGYILYEALYNALYKDIYTKVLSR